MRALTLTNRPWRRQVARSLLPLGLAALLCAPLCFWPAPAAAGRLAQASGGSEARAERMLRLLKRRPRNMSVDRWQESRREAARELGRLKERRAVPLLLEIIANERFDVILEIAIDSLGEIGDQRAVPPLRRLLHDPSLDVYVRDAAAGALRKLGQEDATSPDEGKQGGESGSGQQTGGAAGDSGDRRGGGRRGGTVVPRLPEPKVVPLHRESFGKLPALDLELDAELIAFADRWAIVAGAADLRWDKNAEQLSGAFNLRSRGRRQLEKKLYGYSIDGSLDLGLDLLKPPDSDTSWNLVQSLQLNPEIRLYPFRRDLPLLFGQLSGGLGYGLTYAGHPLYFDRRLSFGGNVSVGGGPGYGRIYDVGARLRLRRLEYVLKKAGLLSGPIDLAIGNRLIQAWYRLRHAIGSYQHLGYTLEILEQAGLLQGEPDPATVYRLVRILDDPQLDGRDQGMMFRLGYGYARSLLLDRDDVTLAFLYATARVSRQLTTSRALETDLRFFYQMYGTPDSYGVTARGAYLHYLYSSTLDPLGALAGVVEAGLNNQPGTAFEEGGLGYRLLLGGSYSRFFSRGSRLSASLLGGIEGSAPLVLFTLEAQYGLAYGSFAPAE